MNTNTDEVDRILAQNDEIESQIEKLQDQALADFIEKQEKMMADAEAFWQASDEFIDACAEVSGARSKIFDEDETAAKQAEKKNSKKPKTKWINLREKQKSLRKKR